MAHCYLCGKSLNGQKVHLRRRVPVGEWTRRVYGKGRSVAVVQKMGMRVVCPGCAERMEQRKCRQMISRALIATLLLISTILYNLLT